jgi:Holliday junction resolvase RusA-like endonuclease
LEIVILGQPRTKKNSSRIALINNKRVPLPSKAFKTYEKVALMQLARVQAVHGPVSVRCRYFLQNRKSWPDLVGLLQATSDILQVAKVIDNDKYIVNYDGSEIAGLDKDNPRAEITITPINENSILCEEYVKATARKCDTTKKAKRCKVATTGVKVKPKAPASISYKEYRKLMMKGHHTP